MEPIDVPGQFWSPDAPARRIDGTLTWEPGSEPRITLVSRVIDEQARPIERTGDTGFVIKQTDDPARVVADGVPRVLFGDTEAGPVTCIDSYLKHLPTNLFDFKTPPLQQVWDAYTLILGAHLREGNRTELDAVRFIIDGPGWWAQLPDTGSAVSEAGEILCERSDDGLVWLEYRPTSPFTLRAAGRAVKSVMTLMKLAVDADLTLLREQICVTGQSNWLEVKNDDHDPGKVSQPSPKNLLSPSLVTLERIAHWMLIETEMDGLTAAVAHPLEDQAIQAQAMVVCSLIEGIHKRIVNPKDMYYVDRVRDLHGIAQRIAPHITSPVADWDQVVKHARNDLAHHNINRPLEEQFYNWLIAEKSVTWVLRLCLLAHAKFTDQEIADALADHKGYKYYQENLKMHVKERAAGPL